MKDNSYIVIQGWMINQLNLKNTELIIYAIIYGFSQDTESHFEGSLTYLAAGCNSTKQTVINSLKRLCDDGLIIKISETRNNIIFNRYKINFELLNFLNGGQNILMGGSNNLNGGSQKTLTGGSQKILPNNTSINKLNDKQKEKEAERMNFTDEDFVQLFVDHGVERQKMYDWIKIRKLKKGVNSLSAFELLLKECNRHKLKLSDVVDICISRNWVAFKYAWVKDEIHQDQQDDTNVLKF